MGAFSNSVRRFAVKVEARTGEVFVNIVAAAHASIVEGSPVTGAPGQPVDTGNLKNSWQVEFEGPEKALISTNVEYAPAVEENLRGVDFHNHGPHSVALTIAGLGNIVENEARKLTGGAP
jgi:hypothetical protein